MRSGVALAVACLAVLVLVAAGSSAMAGDGRTPTDSEALDVTTGEPLAVNETDADLRGTVAVEGGNASGIVRVEYRRQSGDGGWERSRPRNFTVTGGDGRPRTFGWYVTGLEPATTYEYRVVAATANGSDAGQVRTFTTAARSPRTRTATPPPCPSFRGASALCTGTPTPTPPPTPVPADDVADDPGPDPVAGSDDWLSGLAPLFAWAAVVVVLAPLVLGGLLWLDALRGGGSE